MALGPIPVVDIAPYLAGAPDDKLRIAAEVARACEEIGFLMIDGHGVDRELIDETLGVAWAFFDQPDREKRRWASRTGDGRRGYLPVGGNALAYTLDRESPPDLIEAFTFGRFDLPRDLYYTDYEDSWFEPNIWPDKPPAMRNQLCAYYREMERLANDLMRIFAVALDLPEDFFSNKIDKHITAMRLNHYAKADKPPLPGQLRAGPHTDYGSLTILYPTPNPGGLQVHIAGAWRDVQPTPYTFVVNLGDLMAQWTNDRWVSTLHRVANPPMDRFENSRRASIAFFHQPNYDARIECLETCKGPGNPAKYAPITSGDHLLTKTSKETGVALDRAAD